MLQENFVRFGEEVTHTFSVIEVLGDFDGDGDVDENDFNNYLRINMLTAVGNPYADGDVTGDAFVGLEDFELFRDELYEGATALSFGVPEPGTWTLILAAAATLIVFRVRRHSTAYVGVKV